jgi:hypothetical protein
MSLNVREFGAVGDNHTLDHPAIQAALDAATAQGGGEVRVPAGRYRCGMLRLRSNVALLLEAGAVLVAVMDDPALYPIIAPTPHQNKPGQIQALFLADEVENVGIGGQGMIDGACYAPLDFQGSDAATWRLTAFFARNCRQVRITDITLRGIDFWTLHLQHCEQVMIRGITIDNHPLRYNNDGIDPDGCRYVSISDCHIQTCDDCIVLKSTAGRACEHVTIANCVLSSTIGSAIKCGTEAVGDIRYLTVTNCTIHDSEIGLALYLKDGSSYEQIVISNIVIDATTPRCNFPIFIDHTPRYYRTPTIGQMQDILLSNISIRGHGRVWIEGQPSSPIRRLSLHNIHWQISGQFNPQARKPGGTRRKELDPALKPATETPYLFILRHIEGLAVQNIQAGYAADLTPDRGGLYLDHASLLNAAEIQLTPLVHERIYQKAPL